MKADFINHGRMPNGTSTLQCLPKRCIDATRDPDSLLDEILDTISECAEYGPDVVMRRREEALGYQPLNFGDYFWLKEVDWDGPVVISQDGNKIRIVAVISADPGNGIFGTMISDICASGFRPVVIAPLPQMQSILKRWGWRSMVTGGTFGDRETHWWPSRKWIEERAKK